MGAKVLARSAAVWPQGKSFRQLVQTLGAGSLAQNKPRTTTSRYAPARSCPEPRRGVLHRLSAFGYLTLEELRGGFEERPCEHCPHITPIPDPLPAFLPRYRAAQTALGPLENAAALVRQFQKNLPLLLEVARAALPPPDEH
ncbi:hypothetical protein GWK47_035955 [Chionoecetes opilio]|uniref:Uncharacterized protein n=1 Tax=Chionoecetes opilio TaxID=41210 RepID=A0A8J4YEV3_CHIOP|nr:hypothetical protein GWK47_035955 [Chionoecetes opilio]